VIVAVVAWRSGLVEEKSWNGWGLNGGVVARRKVGTCGESVHEHTLSVAGSVVIDCRCCSSLNVVIDDGGLWGFVGRSL